MRPDGHHRRGILGSVQSTGVCGVERREISGAQQHSLCTHIIAAILRYFVYLLFATFHPHATPTPCRHGCCYIITAHSIAEHPYIETVLHQRGLPRPPTFDQLMHPLMHAPSPRKEYADSRRATRESREPCAALPRTPIVAISTTTFATTSSPKQPPRPQQITHEPK